MRHGDKYLRIADRDRRFEYGLDSFHIGTGMQLIPCAGGGCRARTSPFALIYPTGTQATIPDAVKLVRSDKGTSAALR